MTTWTTNGSLGQLSKLREVTKQVQDKGRPTNVTLVPILNEFQLQAENEVKINFKDAVPDDANLKIKTFISFSFDLKLLTKLVLNFYLSIIPGTTLNFIKMHFCLRKDCRCKCNQTRS